MPVDTRFHLSRLQPLAERLSQGANIDSGLLEALEEALPKKGREQVLHALDRLLQEPQGAQALALTFCFLLDEWLGDGGEVLRAIHQAAEPFEWLATRDHLDVVQEFRQLL